MRRLQTFPFYHPVYAVGGIAAVSVVAAVAARAVPFYRRAVGVEAATRLTPLDGLRGLLCFAVLFSHGAANRAFLREGIWAPPPSAVYELLGELAVDLFFCVTGFLFWSRVLATEGQLDAWPFLRARGFRVVPLYACSCALALAAIGPRVRWGSAVTWRGVANMALVGLRPWAHNGTWPTRGGGTLDVNLVDAGVTWTLAYEWAFYLAMPALAVCVRVGQPRRLLLAAAGLLLVLGPGPHLCFGTGILAAYAARHRRVAPALRTRWAAAVAAALLLGLPLVTHTGYGRIALVATTVAFVPIACGNSLFGVLGLSGLRAMGIVSYSVYLLHGIALYLARPLLARWAGDAPADVVRYWAAVVVLAVGVLVIAGATFRWVEFPAIAFEKRFRRGAPTDLIVR